MSLTSQKLIPLKCMVKIQLRSNLIFLNPAEHSILLNIMASGAKLYQTTPTSPIMKSYMSLCWPALC